VEAARTCGASDTQIIFRVMLKESLLGVVLNITVLVITLISYSAMTSAIGGGGLGVLAYNYGYLRFRTDIMLYSIGMLILLVHSIQTGSNFLYNKLR